MKGQVKPPETRQICTNLTTQSEQGWAAAPLWYPPHLPVTTLIHMGPILIILYQHTSYTWSYNILIKENRRVEDNSDHNEWSNQFTKQNHINVNKKTKLNIKRYASWSQNAWHCHCRQWAWLRVPASKDLLRSWNPNEIPKTEYRNCGKHGF